MSEKPARPLTPKQQRFVAEYLIDLNATQAAIRAGYSAHTANEQGSQLLANLSVAAEVQRRRQEQLASLDLDSRKVLQELAILCHSDVRDFDMTEDGDLVLRPEASEAAWRAVSSVKRKTKHIPQKNGEPITERDLEFRLWDKNTAISNAMKHLGLLKDNGGVTINQQFVTVHYADEDAGEAG